MPWKYQRDFIIFPEVELSFALAIQGNLAHLRGLKGGDNLEDK